MTTTILVIIAVFALALIGFNILMGYKKGNISLELDGRYENLTDRARAITEELEKQGKIVEYNGEGHFHINGAPYVVLVRNVSMGGAPLERTVLIPEKNAR